MRLNIDDVEIEVDCEGESGPAIILVHGLGGSRKTWEALRPLLASKARVLVPDLRGCGDSTRGTREWTLAQAADDLAGIIGELGLERCVLVGHSLGGVIVQELLIRRPSAVVGGVLISTSSRLNEKATERWLRIADTVESKGLSDSPAAQARGFAETFAESNPEVLARHASISAAIDPKVYAEQARAASAYDYSNDLASVRCPVLVLQGLADLLTPPGGSVLLHRALPDTAQLEMIEDAGHNLPIEKPQLVADLIVGFAERVCAD